jgi:hypothetical protein
LQHADSPACKSGCSTACNQLYTLFLEMFASLIWLDHEMLGPILPGSILDEGPLLDEASIMMMADDVSGLHDADEILQKILKMTSGVKN